MLGYKTVLAVSVSITAAMLTLWILQMFDRCWCFSGAEERRSGSFPWCSRPARQQAQEQIHQHPPLWVTGSKASWVTLSVQKHYQHLMFHVVRGGNCQSRRQVSFWVRFSPSELRRDADCLSFCRLSLQTTSAGWSWCRCTTTKVQTTSTPTTYLWVWPQHLVHSHIWIQTTHVDAGVKHQTGSVWSW